MDNKDLFESWLTAKAIEKAAVATRRKVEDRLAKELKVPEDLDGTFKQEAPGGYTVKIIGRMTRKVDSEKIQEIAAEQGTSEHIQNLFSWKPTIIVSAWEHSDASITTPLLAGITTTPSRPSFTITKE